MHHCWNHRDVEQLKQNSIRLKLNADSKYWTWFVIHRRNLPKNIPKKVLKKWHLHLYWHISNIFNQESMFQFFKLFPSSIFLSKIWTFSWTLYSFLTWSWSIQDKRSFSHSIYIYSIECWMCIVENISDFLYNFLWTLNLAYRSVLQRKHSTIINLFIHRFTVSYSVFTLLKVLLSHYSIAKTTMFLFNFSIHLFKCNALFSLKDSILWTSFRFVTFSFHNHM